MRKKFVCCLLYVFVFIVGCSSEVGSAAYDDHAFQIDGMYISLDEDIWDLEDADVFVVSSDNEDVEVLGLASVLLQHELKTKGMISPMLQLSHYHFKEWDYTEYWDDVKNNMSMSEDTEVLEEEYYSVEKYDAWKKFYRREDTIYYSISIAKGHYVYNFEYIAPEVLFYDYFDEVKNAAESIHIKSMR